MTGPRAASVPITRWTAGTVEKLDDAVAVERALEIRLDGRSFAVTLRTPGDDEDLVTGFLANEGVIRAAGDLAAVELEPATCADEPDLAEVRLAAGVKLDWSRFERHFAVTSACGLCGRAHLDSLRAGLTPIERGATVSARAIAALSSRLAAAQPTFAATGGLHAAAFCAGPDLAPVALREDVGRHNAVDKVCGALLREGRAPATGGVLWVSGRAGAEIVLKAARARIPVLAAVGAPTSLSVELARLAGLTLIGFLRDGRMNVYTGEAGLGA